MTGHLVERNAAIVDAIRRTGGQKGVAAQFGISPGRVCHIVARHEALTGERLPRAKGGGTRSARIPDIIAMVQRTGTLAKAAIQFGLTSERVRQIVVRHEREAGARLPRRAKREATSA
jgi:hypothetical protein